MKPFMIWDTIEKRNLNDGHDVAKEATAHAKALNAESPGRYFAYNNTRLDRDLGCSCCGSGAVSGRQWWNRDTGYGICGECIADFRRDGMPESEIRDNYGVEGVHFNVKAPS